jgi:hypothetical protein
MATNDPFGDNRLQRLRLCLYLIPVLGAIPSLWVVTQAGKDSSQVRSIARRSILLTGSWLLIYGLLWWSGLQSSELISLRLLYLNSLLTSGYFIICLVLSWQVIRGKGSH